MRTKTFDEGIDELKKLVGAGVMKGTISVNQVYAHYQDSGKGPHGTPAIAFDHPRGGQPMYLSGPVKYRRNEVMERWARHVLDGRLVEETIDILHSFSDNVSMHAPREFDILRDSTALKLHNGNRLVFDRPALIPRLTEGEIKSIRKASRSTGPSAYRTLRMNRG